MLSSVAASLAQLTPLPAGAEDAPRAGASRSAAPRAVASGATSPSGAARAASAARTTRSSGTTSAARSSAAGYAKATSSSSRTARSSSPTKKPGPLAFLDDPKLSVEEKLLRLLGYLNDKWNKDLDKKMKEFKDVEKVASSAGTPRSSSSSLFKKVASFASAALPGLGLTAQALEVPAVRSALSSLAGPALAAAATAMGQPALAPLALKLGPDLVDLAADAATSLDGGGSTSGGSGATRSSPRTATKETADGLGSDRNAQLKLMEMQRILDQQKEMFSLVSNLLRTTHETRMAVIQNVR